jgi:hypothetical protein
VTLHDLKKILNDSTQQEDGFKEVHRRKRHCNEEPAQTMRKVALPASNVKVATKNFFAPSGQTIWTLIPLTQSPLKQTHQFKKNRTADRPQ